MAHQSTSTVIKRDIFYFHGACCVCHWYHFIVTYIFLNCLIIWEIAALASLYNFNLGLSGWGGLYNNENLNFTNSLYGKLCQSVVYPLDHSLMVYGYCSHYSTHWWCMLVALHFLGHFKNLLVQLILKEMSVWFNSLAWCLFCSDGIFDNQVWWIGGNFIYLN